MIDKLCIGGAVVYATDISAREGETKGSAEKRTVRDIIKAVFGPEAILSHNPDGSPFLDGIADKISVSHGSGKAIVAVMSGDGTVGVDIESARPQLERVKAKFVCDDDSQSLPLVKLWTAKEAAFKAAGLPGLVISQIVINCDDSDEVWALLPDGRKLSVAYDCYGSDVWIAVATSGAQEENHE